jgi:hypothetical protein
VGPVQPAHSSRSDGCARAFLRRSGRVELIEVISAHRMLLEELLQRTRSFELFTRGRRGIVPPSAISERQADRMLEWHSTREDES